MSGRRGSRNASRSTREEDIRAREEDRRAREQCLEDKIGYMYKRGDTKIPSESTTNPADKVRPVGGAAPLAENINPSKSITTPSLSTPPPLADRPNNQATSPYATSSSTGRFQDIKSQSLPRAGAEKDVNTRKEAFLSDPGDLRKATSINVAQGEHMSGLLDQIAKLTERRGVRNQSALGAALRARIDEHQRSVLPSSSPKTRQAPSGPTAAHIDAGIYQSAASTQSSKAHAGTQLKITSDEVASTDLDLSDLESSMQRLSTGTGQQPVLARSKAPLSSLGPSSKFRDSRSEQSSGSAFNAKQQAETLNPQPSNQQGGYLPAYPRPQVQSAASKWDF